jgi:hypothetical protein
MHVEKYPLQALAWAEIPRQVPVVFGITWYSSFDTPVRKSDGTWWIEDKSNLGSIRGGHAICDKMSDYTSWWDYYNQGNTGECVGYSSSRMMTLLNRAKYDAPWLYFNAEDNAGQPRDPFSGTFVRSAGNVLVAKGHKTPRASQPALKNGISAFRWATHITEIIDVLDSPNQELEGAVRLLNSWGRDYPHVVRMPYTLIERLLNEDGECMVITDR